MHICLLALALAATVTGCGFHTITPPGQVPTRYRDPVFEHVSTTVDVTYGRATDQRGRTIDLKMDIYEPVGDTIEARPAIVWVHGGNFTTGTKTSPEIVVEAQDMAHKGYVSVSINYRLYGPGCPPSDGDYAGCVQAMTDAQHDAQAAVRFLRQNAATYRIDAQRIAIGGTSAGGITALHVGANSDDPGDSGNSGYSSAVRAVVSLSGALILGRPQVAGDAPSLLFHGDADPAVPYQWAVDTVNDAHAAGLVSYLTTYPGEGHVPWNHEQEILAQTTNFLFWMLKLPNTPG